MNRFPLLGKLLAIGALMAVLLIALAMVRAVITERTSYRHEAQTEVAAAHAGPQTLIGPVLWLPYTETAQRTVNVETDGVSRQRVETFTEEHVLLVYPTTLNVRSQLGPEQRRRGIFPVTVYTSQHHVTGQFTWTEPQPSRPGAQVTVGRPLLLMGVADARGLLGVPRLTLAGTPLTLSRAPARAPLPLAAELPADLDPALRKPGSPLALDLQFDLAGTSRIGWVPLADDTTVTLTSAWPHPSFGGSFLPRTRSVSHEGFEATWRVPALSTQARAQFTARGEHRPAPEQFHVTLADPVDPYRLADRAAKYGLLFIVLTFAAFFVLETVRRWRIHPLQYLMIGAALVLFFLLLLSLGEHLPFAAAYALASAGCIGLLAHYLRHVLSGWRPALGMSALLVALYGVLYGILMSEDNALLMGSLLLFGVLATVMTVTRRVDWYRLGSPAGAGDPST
ncbi:MAG: cell envelope integrity protein CreD [Rubrivivax sp.]|jgi:inner membrane protein